MGIFSFFKGNKSKGEAVPEWASYMSQKEFEHFMIEVRGYFTRKGITYRVEDGVVHCEGNDAGFGQMGLHTLCQKCHRLEHIRLYRKEIEGHFDSLVRDRKFQDVFAEQAGNFDYAKQYIGVRLYPSSYIQGQVGGHALYKQFSEDIIEMLVFDLPDSVSNIQPDYLNKWGKSLEEVYQYGIENMRRVNPLQFEKAKVGEQEIWFAGSDHFFAANAVYELSRQPRLLGKYGALISMPHRHAALIYPIEGSDVIVAFNTLAFVTSGMYKEGPGSLSGDIYLYRNGTFTNLPYHLTDEGLQVRPPKEFVELLEQF